MVNLKNQPILTDTYESPNDFIPELNSIYVYGETDEIRSTHITNFASQHNITLLKIRDIENNEISIEGVDFYLRSIKSLSKIWENTGKLTKIYIDITGLSHSIWSAIIKSAIDEGFVVLIVYVEPRAYIASDTPIQGQFYDLSESILGISPLPGYATLNPKNDGFLFIPILGFEGTRLKYIIEQIQPDHRKMFPIVGLPGFRSWYVFESLKNNVYSLKETRSWELIKYVPSDCPFSCYYQIEKIFNDYQDMHFKIAPLGTKPHALAAIMFYLNHPEVEIIYDHPVRKPGRTDGTAKLHVFHISSIVKANPDRLSVQSRRVYSNV